MNNTALFPYLLFIPCLITAISVLVPPARGRGNGGDPRLSQLVDDNRGAMIISVQELIRIKSIKGDPVPGMPFGPGPAEALDKALAVARGMGFNTTNLDGYAGYAEFGDGDEYVGVLAHLDVVPEGEGWTYPPYAAEIHDGKIYGRGAIDDKGPAMAALYAAKALNNSGLPRSKKVRVIFGTTEETGREDVMYYLSHEKPPVLGFTPDGRYPVVYAEKGNASFNLVRDLVDRSSGTAVTRIQGGTAGNSVPDQARAEVITSDPAALIQACQSFESQTGYDLQADDVSTLLKVYSEMTGEDGEPLAMGGGTYAKQMPNIVAFGPAFPGRPMVEHKPDEYISIQDLVLDARIYARAIYELAR